MKPFKRLVAIEDTLISEEARNKLSQYAEKVELFDTLPENDEEVIRRIDTVQNFV